MGKTQAFWLISGPSVAEKTPLIARRHRLSLAYPYAAAAALAAFTTLVAFLHYFVFVLEEPLPFTPRGIRAGFEILQLASKFIQVDLAECSIPPVESRNWSHWIGNYTPPSCPPFARPRSAPVGRDQVLMNHNTNQFTIHPVEAPLMVPATPEYPSVAVIFIDAVSRASFFRSFEKSAAALQARMGRGEAFTFAGLASSDRYTPPNAAMVLAGTACSDGVLTGFVYQTFCEVLARSAFGDVALWEIARRAGMVTSASIEDWNELSFLHRGKWDHHFHAKNVAPVEEHTTDYGHLRCFGGQEVSGAQLAHTRAVHEAYDSTGGRVFSFTYLTSMHQPDTRHGRVVDDELHETLSSFARLETPTAVLLFADHGTQFASDEDEQAERYLPLGVFMPPRGAPPSWTANLRSNQLTVTSMADLHSTVLGRIDPHAVPLHASWPYKAMLMWPIQAVDLATTAAAPRLPAALGIQRRHHPCSSPWVHVGAAEVGDADLAGAAGYLVQQVNDLSGAGRLGGGPCRPVRLLNVSGGKLYTREPFQLKLTVDVETVPTANAPQHNATYFASVHRFWGFCRGYMKSACLFGGIFPWQLDEIEPLSVYSQYEACMGKNALTDRKRFCICDS